MRYVTLLFLILSFSYEAYSACGATTRTWDGGDGSNGANGNYWSSNGVWSGNNRPNSAAENAVIPSAGVGYLWMYSNNETVGCVEVTSGLLGFFNRTLTVEGDYFRALTPSSVYYDTGQTNARLTMGGTGPQTLEMVDELPNLTISNNTSVTFTDSFQVRYAPTMSGTTTTLYIDADFTVNNNSLWTVPAGVTVVLRNSATVDLAGDLTINGTFIMQAGTSLLMANNRTITVNAGGLFKIEGASGNPVTVSAASGDRFAFNIAGLINAEYFRMYNMDGNGLNVTGTIQKLQYGDFRNLPAGYGLTIGATASLPSTMPGLGFYDELGTGTGNIDASAYAGSPGDTYIDGWTGDIGGEGNDLDSNASCAPEPNGCITWGTEANTQLTVTNSTASGSPPATITASSGDTLFGTYAFALTKVDTATDITSITFTHVGSAAITELDDLKVYDDTNGNCAYNAGTDTQIGSDITLTGSPATATITIPPGTLTVNSTAPQCIHLVTGTTALAVRNNDISLEIQATDDVTNSFGYTFSPSSGLPVNTGTSVIDAGFISQWTGNQSTNSQTNGNWFLNNPPSTTENCQIGAGERVCQLTADFNCQTAELPSAGTLDFASAARIFNVYGNLTVESGYTFQNAALGIINMRGSINQGLEIGESFPGDLTINNTGAAGSNKIITTNSTIVAGDVTVTSGQLVIGSGSSLTVGGNLTIQTGAEVEIQAGGQLILSNGSVVTVDAGGTLTVLGTSGTRATITSVDTSSAYTITVNGTISARYYTISRLGNNGLTVNGTIDATNHFQDGTFSYPTTASTTFLRLFTAVPTNAIDDITFESGGSPQAGTINIYTDASIGAGTLTVNNYAGNLSGATYDNDNTYLISWTGATNTLEIANASSTPASFAAGDTVNMGRWSFQQTLAGASFSDTDITSFRVTMTGTGSTNDVDSIKLYYDSDCDSASGTLLGSQSPTGNPGSATFSIGAGLAPVEADAATPPTRCFYVEYDVASSVSDGKTLGASINASSSIVNDQSYAASGSVSFPVTLGTAGTITGSSLTIWTGSTNTDWYTAGNWTAGVPSATVSCEIASSGNNPTISGGTAVCKNVDITNGSLTMANGSGATLEVYGNFENTGTFTQNDGVLTIRDDGATQTNQRIESANSITNLSFNKTAGGEVLLAGSTTITTLTFPASQNFTFVVQSAGTLNLSNNVTIPAGVTFEVEGAATLSMGSGTSLNVTGGQFVTSGVNDAYPQSTSNKATLTGAGRWSFNASSGSVTLQGFLIDNIDVNGLQISGSANLVQFDGGQFTNLLADWGTPVRALNLSTSATITETTASNVGFNWGAANGTFNSNPAQTDSYYLVYATACGGQNLTFSQWFGNFWGANPQPDTQAKILDSADGAYTCTVTIDASASPVSLAKLEAKAYDSVVDVHWETTSEINHQGFNVYRSFSPNSGLVQVNSGLIKNIKSTPDGRGVYVYRDSSVSNDKDYYYFIEDVAFNGSTTMHGPLSARPQSSKGVAPALGNSDGSGESNGNPDDPDHSNDIIKELAPDVHILSQSGNTLRIEVVPSAETLTASEWDANYNTISIPHYAQRTQASSPATLERVILVPLDSAYSSLSTELVAAEDSVAAALKLAPVPDWVLNGGTGQLEPQWSLGSDYSLNSYMHSNRFEVEPATKEVQGKHYAVLKVWPIQYHPINEQYVKLNRLVIDLYTGGSAWQEPGDLLVESDSPYNADNVAILAVSRSGMYEVSFQNLVDENSEGPFEGRDINQLRIYAQGQEVPIEVISADGVFGSGDKIRFYAVYQDSIEDSKSRVVLAARDLYDSQPGLRMATDSAAVDSSESQLYSSLSTELYEQNNYELFDLPIGGHVDHYYWQRILVSQGTEGAAAAQFDTTIELTDIDYYSGQSVDLNLHLRARGTDFNVNPDFKLALFLNGNVTPIQEISFSGTQAQNLVVSLPSSAFEQGSNDIRVQVLSETLTSASEWAIIDINKLEVSYPRYHYLDSGQLVVLRKDLRSNLEIQGAPVAPNVYDVSFPHQVKKLSAGSWQAASGDMPSSYVFNPSSQFVSDPQGGPLGWSGFKIIASNDDGFLSVDQIYMNVSYSQPLRLTSNEAEYLIIGHSKQLEEANRLAEYRRSQGLKTRLVDLNQIYNEFAEARVSTQAIKDFINYALNYWQVKPRYVLFVGDSTVDPRNHSGNSIKDSIMPARLIEGQHTDYPSDLWFVSDEVGDSWAPKVAVGRIPSQSLNDIRSYIDKVIAYESGELLSDSGAFNLNFYSDTSVLGSGFGKLSNDLASSATQSYERFNTSEVLRDNYSNSDLKQKIVDDFHQAPSLVTVFNGHGGEDMWAASDIFHNNDISSLQNDSLAIGVALNCLNGFSQSSDPSAESIGEKLVLKQEGGMIAFWGSTTMTSPGTQKAMAGEFFSGLGQKLSANDRESRLGDTVLLAQSALPQNSGYRDVMMSYSLMGDPALKFPEKVYPLEVEQESPAPKTSTPVATPAASRGGGCSAFASSDPIRTTGYLDLFFGFLLEVLLCLAALRTLRRL